MKANPNWYNIHEAFRLNGIRYAFEDLGEIGYSLVKEGEDFEIGIGDFLMDWASEKPTLEVQTSGSTGTPKTVVLKKAQMINSARATGAHFELSEGDSALLCLPCTGIAGKMMLVRAMVLGLRLDYVRPSSDPLSDTSKGYDFVAMVPLQLQNSLKHLDRIKALIVGGAPVSVMLRNQVKTLKTQVFETYGMTETITHIASKKLSDESSRFFRVLPNVNISQDDRGCLVIDAPNIAEDSINTNDLVDLVDENTFQWLGRADSIINSGGVKLVPEQIEEKISEVMTHRFFLTGLPDEKLGQKLVLLIENGNLDKTEVLENLTKLKNLSKYEIPKEVVLLENFAETSTGKILRADTVQKIR
ncbi:O-succinylbenzoic acid--CoA ligase [Flagellimonas allohymeniacidonis]|uniref:O-succinylbenzoic acid--CoA ligase n=2 Tax=Flagellimonas allohymeniacidonis TaxID=2517819 RepID=A0A4Q8QNC2_9FLAO|nr:O-succinylbenzoic acid--CoA ligase [Allomuricauda hymeniacidonis]